MQAATVVRNARRVAGLSQTQLAERSGVAASAISQIEAGKRNPSYETVTRLIASTGGQLVSVPTRIDTAASLALQIAEDVRAGKQAYALRAFIQLNDNLCSVEGSTRLALCMTEPAPTGSKRWDAAIAALVAYRLRQQGVLAPTWVNDPSRFLGKVWNISEGTYSFVVDVNDVPKEFLERGTLVAARDLESV
jgi:transcriptional regulator with XRE-family HTH domain